MYTIIINPETFEIYKVVEEDNKPLYHLELKKVPPKQVNVYDVIDIKSIEDINFDQILHMIYSEDEETQTMALDMLKTHDYDHTEDMEKL